MEKQEILKGLASFSGTCAYYKTMLNGFYYTDGVQFLAENTGAYWLIDLVISYQQEPKVIAQELQCWKLTVKDAAGLLIMTDGNNNEIIKRRIEFTDFPLDEIELWVEGGRDDGDLYKVIYLPSEH